jgi:hypothetical protein
VFFEGANGAANVVIAEIRHRFAIRFLVAGVDEGVQREGIIVGSRNAFFDQRAENTSFDIAEDRIHIP